MKKCELSKVYVKTLEKVNKKLELSIYIIK